ncbi:hypothetical protein QYF36_006122 [Acer negundo]|nr:hypothetical protein QYF36_006122 [Acer negundo]
MISNFMDSPCCGLSKPTEQSTFEKSGASKETFMDMDGSKENGDIDFHMDSDGYHVQTVFEGEMEKNNVSTAVHLEKVEGGDDEFSAKVDGDTEIIHVELKDTSVSAVLSKEDEVEEMLSNDVEKADPQNLGLDKLVKQPQSVDEYPS